MGPRTRRPRLLVVTPDYPPARGGIQLLAHRVAVAMEAFDTRVVALDGPGAASFDASVARAPDGVGAAGLDARGGVGAEACGTFAVRRVRTGGRLGMGRMVALNAAAVREALRFRPDVTLSMHVVASPAAALIRGALGARTAQYFHANELGDKPRLAAFAVSHADVAVAVSSYTAELIAATCATPGRLRIIPPGVDLPGDVRDERDTQGGAERPAGGTARPIGSAERAPGRAGPPTVLTIARLKDSYKGHDVLIGALALVRERVRDAELVVVGDGPLRGGLERLADETGVGEAVSFVGAVSDEERDGWLRRADVFAMPSRLPSGGLAGEGFGIVYLEAAAYGLPVVAGNVAGALDAVADGETGLLVDPTDPRAVAEALCGVLLDGELARRLGRAGAERAREFAWPHVTARVESALLELVAERAVGTGRGR